MTTEAEGPGLVLGATLGGKRAALLMQSSGVGNSVNMFSILKSCGIPCLLIVTMRGEFDDFNPWQVSMGAMTELTLKACGFLTYRVERAEDVEDIVSAGCNMAYGSHLQVAILLAQRLDKALEGSGLTLDRREFVARLLADRGELLSSPGWGRRRST